MSQLLATVDELIASATAPSTRHDDLRDYVERQEIARQGRAEGARERSRERSEAVRGLIRTALGAAPLTQPTTSLVRTAEVRLGRNAPSRRVIRDEILRLKENLNFGTGTTSPSA